MKKFVVFLPVFVLLIVSCSKSKEQKKIIGSWEYQFFQYYDDNRTITWVFADDGTMTQFFNSEIKSDTVVASYRIDANFGDAYYLTVDGIDENNDGKYQILKLNKKFLIIQRVEYKGETKGVFSRKEFVKK